VTALFAAGVLAGVFFSLIASFAELAPQGDQGVRSRRPRRRIANIDYMDGFSDQLEQATAPLPSGVPLLPRDRRDVSCWPAPSRHPRASAAESGAGAEHRDLGAILLTDPFNRAMGSAAAAAVLAGGAASQMADSSVTVRPASTNVARSREGAEPPCPTGR